LIVADLHAECRFNSNFLKETGISFMEQHSRHHFSGTDVKQSLGNSGTKQFSGDNWMV
jgi:hypothetical protein